MTWTYRVVAGTAFMPFAPQAQPAVNESNVALTVFFVAVGLTLLLAGGLALLMWILSWRSPHAVVGAAPKSSARQREELPAGVHLPTPSFQPLILAAGITILVIGIVFRGFAISLGEGFSIPLIMVLGLIIVVAGFIGWIRENRKEAQSH
jgi:hypothetical protein